MKEAELGSQQGQLTFELDSALWHSWGNSEGKGPGIKAKKGSCIERESSQSFTKKSGKCRQRHQGKTDQPQLSRYTT